VTVPDTGDGFTTDNGGGSPTSSGGLGGLVPTSILGNLLPSHASGAAQQSPMSLKGVGVGSVVAMIIMVLRLF